MLISYGGAQNFATEAIHFCVKTGSRIETISDSCFLILAKSRHKLFWAQFLFGTKIKTSYENVLQNT